MTDPDPDLVAAWFNAAAEELRGLIDAFTQMATTMYDAIVRVCEWVQAFLDGLRPSDRRRMMRGYYLNADKRAWAHYARHAGTPRSRSRPGRRR